VHKPEVEVGSAELLQRVLESLLGMLLVRVVELRGEEDLPAGDTGVPDTPANLGLVSVGSGGIDILVSKLESLGDSTLDNSGLGLPGTCKAITGK
jgi:hypothetical protein